MVTCYNYGCFLDECIESCLRQSYAVHEVVVVDDGSTDDSAERLRRWQERDPRVVAISQANAGISAATMAGLERCRGEVILLVDADDHCAPERAAAVVAAMRVATPDGFPGWVHHPLRKFSDRRADLGTMPTYVAGPPQGWFGAEVAATAESPLATPTSGLALRRDLLAHLLPLDVHRDTAQDIQLWHLLPLIAAGVWIAQPLAHYRVHGGSDSAGAATDQLTTPRLIRRQRIRCERCHDHVERWLGARAPEALAAYPPIASSLTFLELSFLDVWYNDARRDRARLRQVLGHPRFAGQHWQQRWFWRAAGILPRPLFRWFTRTVFGSGGIKRLIRRLLGRR
jgi:hypothetical protein